MWNAVDKASKASLEASLLDFKQAQAAVGELYGLIESLLIEHDDLVLAKVFFSGKPPSRAWYAADYMGQVNYEDPTSFCYRWWDGQEWSDRAYFGDDESAVLKAASVKVVPEPGHVMFWRLLGEKDWGVAGAAAPISQ